MIWIISGIIVGTLIAGAAAAGKKGDGRRAEISDSVCTFGMAGLMLVFAFLLLYKVREIPVPFNVDEAGMAYDAKSLAEYHVDRFLYHFPVYLINFGGGQSALYAYLAAMLIKLFGFSVLIVRLPAILLSLLSALAFSLTIRKEHGNTAALVSLVLFCILPFSIMHSRWGLDAYLLFPMLILSCCAFYHAVKTEKPHWFLLSGVLFGLTLYTYVISYMLIPLFLGISLLYLLRHGAVRWKNIIVMGFPLFLLALPLMLMLLVNNGTIAEIRTRFISIPRLEGFRANEIGLKNILTNLKLDGYNIFYEIFANDHCRYNVNPRFGTLYYPSIPILIYGLVLCIKKTLREKKFSLDLLMVFLLAASFSVSMLVERPNVNRSCAIYIPLIYFLTAGLCWIMKRGRLLTGLCTCIYVLCFVFFLRYYFTEFPKDLDQDILFGSLSDLKTALDFTETVYQPEQTVYVLGRSNPYIYTILALDVDPYTFDEKKQIAYDNYVKGFDKYRFRPDDLRPDCIYVFRDLNNIPEGIRNFDFQSEQFGSVIVYYPDVAGHEG